MQRHLRRLTAAALLAMALLAAGAIVVTRTSADQVPTATFDLRANPTGASLVPTADLGQAIRRLEARVRRFPGDAQALADLGLAYVQQARIEADPTLYPLAERALGRALAVDPDAPDALVGMGTLALARHGFAEALRWGERAREVADHDADVYGVIGDAQIELGRYQAAFRTFQTMVDMRPDLGSYARVSYARELRGDVDGAVQAMRAALRAAGTPTDAAWASFQLGELAFNRGRVGEAAYWYRRARYLAPEYPPPSAGLAKVAWARGDTARAIAGYRAVVRRYPAPEYVIALDDLYRTSGRPRLAARTASLVRAEQRLFRANGVNVDLELALFEADRGRPRAALTAARAAWRRRRSIQVADALAWSLSQAGRERAAAAFIQRARSLGTRNALFAYHDALIHLRLGDRDAARRLLREALAINPNFSILYRERAEVLLERLRGRP